MNALYLLPIKMPNAEVNDRWIITQVLTIAEKTKI
jgi:hypothetical protein